MVDCIVLALSDGGIVRRKWLQEEQVVDLSELVY